MEMIGRYPPELAEAYYTKVREFVVRHPISNGEEIYFRVAFKPTSTILQDQESVDEVGKTVVLKGKGRHDPCVVPRAVPIVEAMAALVMQQRRDAEAQGLRKPSTAEFLDTVVACRQLKIGPASSAWQQLAQALLGKARASSAAGSGLLGDARP